MVVSFDVTLVTSISTNTRRRIVLAARRLFAEQGYTATTIDAIARLADAGSSTVYAVFGSKRELLREVRRQWIDEADVEPLVAEALAVEDPRSKLRLCARWVRRQMELGQDVITVFEAAAASDPEIQQYWAELRRTSEAKITELVASIRPHLASDLTSSDASAVIWALAQASVYRRLVVVGGWSPDRYERWLSDALQYQLFGCPPRVS